MGKRERGWGLRTKNAAAATPAPTRRMDVMVFLFCCAGVGVGRIEGVRCGRFGEWELLCGKVDSLWMSR